jgi:hypothetical protein
MKRLIFFFALLLGLVLQAYGQTIRRFHQSFEIEDLTAIQVAAEGDVTINTWAGNTILVEIYITTSVGTPALINLLQKDGRYDLLLEKSVTNAVVVNKMKHRQLIKVKGIDMDETIKYTISIPDSFAIQDLETMRSFKRS